MTYTSFSTSSISKEASSLKTIGSASSQAYHRQDSVLVASARPAYLEEGQSLTTGAVAVELEDQSEELWMTIGTVYPIDCRCQRGDGKFVLGVDHLLRCDEPRQSCLDELHLCSERVGENLKSEWWSY